RAGARRRVAHRPRSGLRTHPRPQHAGAGPVRPRHSGPEEVRLLGHQEILVTPPREGNLMKLARTLVDGTPTFLLSEDGDRWVAASSVVPDAESYADLVARLHDGIPNDDLLAAAEVAPAEFLPPTGALDKSIAIGKNYVAHVEETGSDIPTHPVVFSKFPTSFVGATGDIIVDSGVTSTVDYEVELVVVIGKEAKNVSKDDALAVVAGYTVGNDVSARDCQRRDGQFDYA